MSRDELFFWHMHHNTICLIFRQIVFFVCVYFFVAGCHAASQESQRDSKGEDVIIHLPLPDGGLEVERADLLPGWHLAWVKSFPSRGYATTLSSKNGDLWFSGTGNPKDYYLSETTISSVPKCAETYRSEILARFDHSGKITLLGCTTDNLAELPDASSSIYDIAAAHQGGAAVA